MMTKLLFVGLGLLALTMPPALAQEAPATTTRAPRQQTLQRIAEKISQEASIKLLVTSSLAQQLVVPPDTAVTAATLEETLDKLVRRVGDATWAKVYLAPPPTGRRYTPDAVAQYAQAQAGLLGRAARAEPGMIELLGKRMTVAEAQPLITGLGLEPYYVLLSRNPLANKLAGLPGTVIGGPNGSPIMDNLMKQLGVSNPKDIPTGEYEVKVPGPDGTPQNAHVSVTNSEGRMSIGIRLGS